MQQPKARKLVDSLDAVLARLPMDADTYRIKSDVKTVRDFTERLRKVAERKPQPQGGDHASTLSQTR